MMVLTGLPTDQRLAHLDIIIIRGYLIAAKKVCGGKASTAREPGLRLKSLIIAHILLILTPKHLVDYIFLL